MINQGRDARLGRNVELLHSFACQSGSHASKRAGSFNRIPYHRRAQVGNKFRGNEEQF
jgi:hypothetical protein